MMPRVDLERLVPAEDIAGEDAEETRLLKEMLHSATNYLRGFEWCPPIGRASRRAWGRLAQTIGVISSVEYKPSGGRLWKA